MIPFHPPQFHETHIIIDKKYKWTGGHREPDKIRDVPQTTPMDLSLSQDGSPLCAAESGILEPAKNPDNGLSIPSAPPYFPLPFQPPSAPTSPDFLQLLQETHLSLLKTLLTSPCLVFTPAIPQPKLPHGHSSSNCLPFPGAHLPPLKWFLGAPSMSSPEHSPQHESHDHTWHRNPSAPLVDGPSTPSLDFTSLVSPDPGSVGPLLNKYPCLHCQEEEPA